MDKFGEKLRLLRQRRGLSQGELAAMIGVNQTYVGKMERGEKIPNVAMVLKIADVLSITPNQMMLDNVELDN